MKVFKGSFDITQTENKDKGKVAIATHVVQLSCPCLNTGQCDQRKSAVIRLQAKYKALRNADASYAFPTELVFSNVDALSEFAENLSSGKRSTSPLTVEGVLRYAGTLTGEELELLTEQLVQISSNKVVTGDDIDV